MSGPLLLALPCHEACQLQLTPELELGEDCLALVADGVDADLARFGDFGSLDAAGEGEGDFGLSYPRKIGQ